MGNRLAVRANNLAIIQRQTQTANSVVPVGRCWTHPPPTMSLLRSMRQAASVSRLVSSQAPTVQRFASTSAAKSEESTAVTPKPEQPSEVLAADTISGAPGASLRLSASTLALLCDQPT